MSQFKIDWGDTDRGFTRGQFKDRYGQDSSVQVSSIATEDCIWLGNDEPTTDGQGNFCGCRMHLTREMAGKLGAILNHFHQTGELTDVDFIPPGEGEKFLQHASTHVEWYASNRGGVYLKDGPGSQVAQTRFCHLLIPRSEETDKANDQLIASAVNEYIKHRS